MESCIQSSLCKEDILYEVPLRPQKIQDFLGQEQICHRLEISISAAKQRNEALSHHLFCGPPGLGKTTLSNIIAQSMGTNLTSTSGPTIEKPGDLAGLLTNLQSRDVLFIDEIHRLNKVIEEYLYSAMEDFVLDIMIDNGPSARSVQVKLNPFTLIGATTKVGLLSGPFRSRFAMTSRLDYYSPDILKKIIERSCRILNLDIDNEGAMEISRRSRGTPRIANNVLRFVRDYAQMYKQSKINKSVVDNALKMLSIDEQGLDEMDRKILSLIIEHYNGGPVGISTIAVAIGEESSTIEEVYEPYLIMQGFLKRTSRGREVTDLAYRHHKKNKT